MRIINNVSVEVFLGYFTGLRVLSGDLPFPVLIGTATVVHLLDGLICRLLAHNHGYSKNLWTILGIVFGLWALLALVLLPKR
jgi:hypothetical protein